ncbi:hypothetical protein [Bradyrhizobium cenepequi]
MAKADIFAVWGEPPQALTKGLTKRQIQLLKRYTDAVTGKCYRIAFDNGLNHGLSLVSTVASKEMRKQRDRMARS